MSITLGIAGRGKTTPNPEIMEHIQVAKDKMKDIINERGGITYAQAHTVTRECSLPEEIAEGIVLMAIDELSPNKAFSMSAAISSMAELKLEQSMYEITAEQKHHKSLREVQRGFTRRGRRRY